MPLLTYFCIFGLQSLAVNLPTKFEVSSFILYREMEGPKIIKVGHVT